MSTAPVPDGSLREAPSGGEGSLVALLRACSDPARLNILRLLAGDAFGVGELGVLLGLGQATVSHHLKALTETGLLTARRDGTHTFYRRSLPEAGTGAAVHAALLQELDALPLSTAQEDARAAVYDTRAERSREFFSRHADRFESSRDLIALPNAYLPELAELLPTPAEGARSRALEVGPGPGEFLPALATRYEAVAAVDISAEMLERARALIRNAGLSGIELMEGDLLTVDLPAAAYDVAVCAMVLHHVPRPAALFARLASLLAPGGTLLVAELCLHGQDWTRDHCGDVWPGFDTEELRTWATRAGLTVGASQFLAQRNGFRIQLLRFEAPVGTVASNIN